MHAKNVFKFTDINTTICISVTFFHGKGRSPTSKLESVGLQAKMRSSGAENLWRVHQSILREHKMWLGWIELVFSSLKKNIWFFGSNLPPFLSKTLKTFKPLWLPTPFSYSPFLLYPFLWLHHGQDHQWPTLCCQVTYLFLFIRILCTVKAIDTTFLKPFLCWLL